MAENEKNRESVKEKKEEKQPTQENAKRATNDLTREQLETLRHKLHRKFH